MENTTIIKGKVVQEMGLSLFRLMPNANIRTIGSFFLLDYFSKRTLEPKTPTPLNGNTAHPHRGIATVTCMLKGENEHHDSLGNNKVVGSGGLQWMNAGNGIVHDEGMTVKFQKSGGEVHAIQFWILLPEHIRNQNPAYQSLHNDGIAESVIDDQGSKLRVLMGSYGNASSPIPTFNSEFLYHIKLHANAEFYYTVPKNRELGIFAARGKVQVNRVVLEESNLIVSKNNNETYLLKNITTEEIDVLLFGGAPHTESFYSQGPFVMGNATEMQKAYDDYYSMKYGQINY